MHWKPEYTLWKSNKYNLFIDCCCCCCFFATHPLRFASVACRPLYPNLTRRFLVFVFEVLMSFHLCNCTSCALFASVVSHTHTHTAFIPYCRLPFVIKLEQIPWHCRTESNIRKYCIYKVECYNLWHCEILQNNIMLRMRTKALTPWQLGVPCLHGVVAIFLNHKPRSTIHGNRLSYQHEYYIFDSLSAGKLSATSTTVENNNKNNFCCKLFCILLNFHSHCYDIWCAEGAMRGGEGAKEDGASACLCQTMFCNFVLWLHAGTSLNCSKRA